MNRVDNPYVEVDAQSRLHSVISDDLWEFTIRCWAVEADEGPTMVEVYSFFLHQT